MVELDITSGTETGGYRFLVIPGATKAVMQRQVAEHVTPGSLIFTDQHGSYKWLRDYGYVHLSVNHKKREFSKGDIAWQTQSGDNKPCRKSARPCEVLCTKPGHQE
eukprot:6323599-Karenia_brevis.AAC.1